MTKKYKKNFIYFYISISISSFFFNLLTVSAETPFEMSNDFKDAGVIFCNSPFATLSTLLTMIGSGSKDTISGSGSSINSLLSDSSSSILISHSSGKVRSTLTIFVSETDLSSSDSES